MDNVAGYKIATWIGVLLRGVTTAVMTLYQIQTNLRQRVC